MVPLLNKGALKSLFIKNKYTTIFAVLWRHDTRSIWCWLSLGCLNLKKIFLSGMGWRYLIFIYKSYVAFTPCLKEIKVHCYKNGAHVFPLKDTLTKEGQ